MPRKTPITTTPQSKAAKALPQRRSAAAARRQRERRHRARRFQKQGERRLAKLLAYEQQRAAGVPGVKLRREMRLKDGTLWAWKKKFKAGGPAALITRAPSGRPTPRRQAYELARQPKTVSRVQRLAVLKGSAAAGWRAFAQDPLCPAELRSLIQPGCAIPPALVEALELHRRVVTVRVAIYRAGSYSYRREIGKERAA